MSRITKIADKHPHEVLQKEDSIWQYILTILLEYSQSTFLKRKVYCKSYLKSKIQSFCRVLLRHVSFKHIMEAMMRQNKGLRFKDIKYMTGEVFKEREISLGILAL